MTTKRKLLAGVSAAVLTSSVFVLPAFAVPPTCEGQAATVYVEAGAIVGGPNNGQTYIPGTTVLAGTSGNDVIVGTTGNDTIQGFAGNDKVCALAGDDLIDTADGNDTVNGDDGNDTITTGIGNDTINAGAGNDQVNAGDGNNTVNLGDGNDSGTSLGGNDTFDGGPGTDYCDSGTGNGDSEINCEQLAGNFGVITIQKNAVPDSAQDFAFTGDLGGFSLDDDADPTLPNSTSFIVAAPNASVDVTETAPAAGWTLTGIACNDATGSGSTNVGTRTATIDLAKGESVTCVFTNTQSVSSSASSVASSAASSQASSAVSSAATSSALSSAAASSVASSVSSVGNCPVTDLEGHWKFDEGSGTTAADSSGNGHNGTLEGAPGPTWTATTAPIGSSNPFALSFDGTDDQVRVPAHPDLHFGTGSFTISLFAQTNAGDRSVMGNFGPVVGGHRGYGLYFYSTNRANFFGYGDAGTNDASQPGTLLDNQWHHVAGVYTRSAGNLTIDTYIDGALAGTNTVAVGNITSLSDLLFGHYLLQPNYQGLLDDIRIYSRALSAGEVNGIADGCAGGSSSSSSVASSAASSAVSSAASSAASSAVSSATSSAASSAASVNPALVCNGKTATIYISGGMIVGGPNNGSPYTGSLHGTSGNDVIIGTSGADDIDGDTGNDTICGRGGNDELDGGNGDDALFGEGGQDELDGSNGNDWLDGGADNDVLDGSNNNDMLIGGPGADTIEAGSGDDVACGGAGNDTMKGESYNDRMDGGADTDTMNGGFGSDICRNGETVSACENTVTAVPECAGL